ncbi:M15 family metallopeptidase [Leifsonia aquatica]|uniref:M15 family metallopeptidase n=1 Tax=Leifsonia aquatica TaxID=144185 RepID=UPI00046AB5FF|nr:M15 family metallopeptidase [Leifsonia aquatica]
MVNGPWGGFSNGNIPLTAMTLVNYPGVVYWSWSSNPANGAIGGVYLEPGCAKALVAMLDRYHQQKGGYLPVNEGYRSYAGQVYWANNGTGTTPGTSNHGWGKAVDFDQSRFTQDQYAWVLANCGDFGFEKLGGPFGAFDYIHFNYSGSYTGSGPNPTPVPTQEEDMGQLVKHPNGSVAFAATDGTFTVLTSMDEVNALVATGAAPATLNALPDGFIWNLRLQVAQKRKTQNEI